MGIKITGHDNSSAGDGIAFRFIVSRNSDGEVVATLETFLHSEGPKNLTFNQTNGPDLIDEAYRSVYGVAHGHGITLIEIIDPDGLFPPERRPTVPLCTRHIEERG